MGSGRYGPGTGTVKSCGGQICRGPSRTVVCHWSMGAAWRCCPGPTGTTPGVTRCVVSIATASCCTGSILRQLQRQRIGSMPACLVWEKIVYCCLRIQRGMIAGVSMSCLFSPPRTEACCGGTCCQSIGLQNGCLMGGSSISVVKVAGHCWLKPVRMSPGAATSVSACDHSASPTLQSQAMASWRCW